MPSISVILPTYGKPLFLSQAVESVQRQTCSDWELFVVDDNDPDTAARRETEALMARFAGDGRIQYLRHPRNLNGAVARNTGLAHASGEFAAFLDSDDEYLPQRFARCLEAMARAEESVAGVYTGCEFRRGGKTYHVETSVKPGNFLRETLACTFMFCTGSNLFIRKRVADELHGFDGAFLRHQDYEFLARLFRRNALTAIPEVLVIKNNENFNVPNVEKMIAIKRQYLDKFAEDIAALPKAEQNLIFHSQWLAVAEAAQRGGDAATAREYYKKAAEFGGLTGKERLRRLAFQLLKR